jgi:hypothetical protein
MADDNIIKPEKTPSREEQLASIRLVQEQTIRAENGGILPETDPETASQIERLKALEASKVSPQVPIDDGSDPYVMNGQTTVATAELSLLDKATNYVKDIFGAKKGVSAAKSNAQASATSQDARIASQNSDWRVRLSLAPNATGYLYKVGKDQAGILNPLQETNGVIFPYTPSIQVNYVANYETFDLIHSNYKSYMYKNSSVEHLSISCEFTAQDTYEANYLLAVIHFFRSVTKMFYGKDDQPKAGVPPPLCYLNGLGDFQFNQHPLLITSFTYVLPNDVDYIRAGGPSVMPGSSIASYSTNSVVQTPTNARLQGNGLSNGANAPSAQFTQPNSTPTYVPTKMQIQISAIPIVTRKDISDNFSLRDYATGALLQGKQGKSTGGIW